MKSAGKNITGEIASLPRAISKLGLASRSKAAELIKKGLVSVNGNVIKDTSRRVNIQKDKISVNGTEPQIPEKIYIALNKPHGLLTTTSDEKGRDTVIKCFEKEDFPHIFPVGRLDKASEGLLFITNDTNWGNKITSPESRIEKTYHVQINIPSAATLIDKIKLGIVTKEGKLKVVSIKEVRQGDKNCWVEIVLDEGKNRHIRKIFEALGIQVLRLIRIKIGNVELGNLAKGEFRHLTPEEVKCFI